LDPPGRLHVIDRNVIEELSIYEVLPTFVELCKWLESSCGVRFAFKAVDRHGRKGGHLLRPLCRSARGSLKPASSTICIGAILCRC
jgi:hypothetical protein